MAHLRIVLALGLSALALSVPARSLAGNSVADEVPRVTVSVVDGGDTGELTFKGKWVRRARLNLLVQSSSSVSGDLDVVFLRPKWKPNNPLRATASVEHRDRLQLLWKARVVAKGQPDRSIGAQDATPLILEFRLPPRVPPAAATGTLVVRLANQPQVRPYLLSVAPAKPTPEALRVSQSKAAMLITRICGPLMQISSALREWGKCSKDEDLPVDVTGPVPPLTTTRIGSDRGKSLELSLRGGGAPTLETRDVGGAGTYSGQLVLNPSADKPTSIEATVKVRDFILWPLAVLAIGIGVAYLLQWLQTVYRGRRVLRRRVTAAVNPYLDRRREPLADERERPGIYVLNPLLRPPNLEQYPKKGCTSTDPKIPRLCCNIAGARTTERLTELEKEVAGLEAEFRRTLGVLTAFDELNKAASGLRSDLSIKKDAELILDSTADDYATDEEANKIARTIRQQALITLAYRAVGRMWRSQTSTPWKNTHQWLRPQELYRDSDGITAPTPEEQTKYRRRLTFALRQLHEPENAISDPGPFESGTIVRLLSAAQTIEPGQAWQAVDDALRASGDDQLPSAQSLALAIRAREDAEPERVEGEIQRLDGFLFIGAATVAALAYLLTKYSDTFGTLEDYLLAFAAGAAGTAGINLLLAPFARSRTSLEIPAAK